MALAFCQKRFYKWESQLALPKGQIHSVPKVAPLTHWHSPAIVLVLQFPLQVSLPGAALLALGWGFLQVLVSWLHCSCLCYLSDLFTKRQLPEDRACGSHMLYFLQRLPHCVFNAVGVRSMFVEKI